MLAGLNWRLVTRLAVMLGALTLVAVGNVDTAVAQDVVADAVAPQKPTDADMTRVMLQALAIFGALVVFSVMVANQIARLTRMPDQAFRFALVIFAVVASIVVTVMGWPPKLGIDLSGGVILVYDITGNLDAGDGAESAPGILPKKKMDELVVAIANRVNPGGIKEVTVRPYGLKQIEIIIPEANDQELELIKAKVSTAGALEFRIVADRRDPNNAPIMERATAEDADLTTTEVREPGADGKSEVVARWVPAKDPEEGRRYLNSSNYAGRTNRRGEIEVLMMMDKQNVRGELLRSAKAGFDQQGQHTVHFTFDQQGAGLFGDLTGDNLPDKKGDVYRLLGIILDGKLQTAPRINSRITDRGEITGNFTEDEVTVLAAVLTAGQLPAALSKEPSSSMVVGATLGRDTIIKGVNSMLIATGVVVVFMLFYYRFAGIVANLAVVLNVLLTVAFMILFHAAFTLAGLAGLALTVGMAVDANVLIYERMREELARGATLRMAIRNGFERATTTIVDANVTTLISAVVLYAIGTDQVKGFAVTLILGIVMNLFTAITVSRAIFDVAEKLRWVRELKMLQMLSGTNYDFIGKRVPAITLSVVVITIGLIGVGLRGKGLLDIDFTGGVSVQMVFDKAHPQDIGFVRTKLEEAEQILPDVTVQEVKFKDEAGGLRFLVITSQDDANVVEKKLQELFGDKLAHKHLTVAEVQPVAPLEIKADEKKQTALPSTSANDLALVFDEPQTDGSCADGDKKDDDKKEDKATEEKKADEKPKDEPKKTEEPKAEEKKPAEPKADEKSAPEKKPVDKKTNPFDGGTQAKLEFEETLSHDAVIQLLDTALATDPKTKGAAHAADTAGHILGSERGFKTWTIKLALPQAEAQQVLDRMQKSLVNEPYFPTSSKIGAAVAGNTQWAAIEALLASMVLILAYVWFRFTQVMFGFAAILALIHDVLVTLGALALSYWLAPYLGFALVEPFKINLPVVAAFLTIIGYSLNDTIVIFDRIREIRGKSQELSAELVNLSINQTLSRTLLTSLTVFLVVVILYLIGGEGIHGFAFALVVGVISGTYSTIYIATPALIWLNNFNHPTTNTPNRALASTGKR